MHRVNPIAPYITRCVHSPFLAVLFIKSEMKVCMHFMWTHQALFRDQHGSYTYLFFRERDDDRHYIVMNKKDKHFTILLLSKSVTQTLLTISSISSSQTPGINLNSFTPDLRVSPSTQFSALELIRNGPGITIPGRHGRSHGRSRRDPRREAKEQKGGVTSGPYVFV